MKTAYRYQVYYQAPEFFGDQVCSVVVDTAVQIDSKAKLKTLANIIADATCEDGDLPEAKITGLQLAEEVELGFEKGFCCILTDVRQPSWLSVVWRFFGCV